MKPSRNRAARRCPLMLGRIMDPPGVGSSSHGSGARAAPRGQCSKATVPMLFTIGEARGPPAIRKQKAPPKRGLLCHSKEGGYGEPWFPLFRSLPGTCNAQSALHIHAFH